MDRVGPIMNSLRILWVSGGRRAKFAHDLIFCSPQHEAPSSVVCDRDRAGGFRARVPRALHRSVSELICPARWVRYSCAQEKRGPIYEARRGAVEGFAACSFVAPRRRERALGDRSTGMSIGRHRIERQSSDRAQSERWHTEHAVRPPPAAAGWRTSPVQS